MRDVLMEATRVVGQGNYVLSQVQPFGLSINIRLKNGGLVVISFCMDPTDRSRITTVTVLGILKRGSSAEVQSYIRSRNYPNLFVPESTGDLAQCVKANTVYDLYKAVKSSPPSEGGAGFLDKIHVALQRV